MIGLVVFALAVFVFGRGEQLAPLSPRTSPTELPEAGMVGSDVRKVKFAMALRGYRMSDVDWALERMADELDRLRQELASASGSAVPAAAADPVGSGPMGSDPAGSDPVFAGAQPSLRAATPADESRTAVGPQIEGQS